MHLPFITGRVLWNAHLLLCKRESGTWASLDSLNPDTMRTFYELLTKLPLKLLRLYNEPLSAAYYFCSNKEQARHTGLKPQHNAIRTHYSHSVQNSLKMSSKVNAKQMRSHWRQIQTQKNYKLGILNSTERVCAYTHRNKNDRTVSCRPRRTHLEGNCYPYQQVFELSLLSQEAHLEDIAIQTDGPTLWGLIFHLAVLTTKFRPLHGGSSLNTRNCRYI